MAAMTLSKPLLQTLGRNHWAELDVPSTAPPRRRFNARHPRFCSRRWGVVLSEALFTRVEPPMAKGAEVVSFPHQGGVSHMEELPKPPERLRRLEEAFNDMFDMYTTSYHDGGVSSVYLWDTEVGFAGAFLTQKK
eukprot:4995455-Amphidinium_carterae.1